MLSSERSDLSARQNPYRSWADCCVGSDAFTNDPTLALSRLAASLKHRGWIFDDAVQISNLNTAQCMLPVRSGLGHGLS